MLADEHTDAVKRHTMFGVPDVRRGRPGGVRPVHGPQEPDDIDRVLDLLEWADLNEFKHTSVPR